VTKVKSNQHEIQPEIKSNRSTGISKYLSIITLNVNRINSSIIDTDCLTVSKEDPKNCCLQEKHLTTKYTHEVNMKGREKIYKLCEDQ
jgi:hypothetical protein